MGILDFIKGKNDPNSPKAKREAEMKLAFQRKAEIAEKERLTGKKIMDVSYGYRNLMIPTEIQIGPEAYQQLLTTARKSNNDNSVMKDIMTTVILTNTITTNFLTLTLTIGKNKELLEKFLAKNPGPKLRGVLQIEFRGNINPKTYEIQPSNKPKSVITVSQEFNFVFTIVNQNNSLKSGEVLFLGITSM